MSTSARRNPPEEKKTVSRPRTTSSSPSALAQEAEESLRLFMCGLEHKGDKESWETKFEKDAKKELGLAVRARLNREDYRRPLLNGMLTNVGGCRDRDSAVFALGEVEIKADGIVAGGFGCADELPRHRSF